MARASRISSKAGRGDVVRVGRQVGNGLHAGKSKFTWSRPGIVKDTPGLCSPMDGDAVLRFRDFRNTGTMAGTSDSPDDQRPAALPSSKMVTSTPAHRQQRPQRQPGRASADDRHGLDSFFSSLDLAAGLYA